MRNSIIDSLNTPAIPAQHCTGAKRHWWRDPFAWLIILISYAPFHYTIRAAILSRIPVLALFSTVWVDLIITSLFLAGFYKSAIRKPFKFTPLDVVTLCWFSSALISGIFSPSVINAIAGFRLTYLPVLLYFIIRFFNPSLDVCYRILRYAIYTCAIVAILGVFMYFCIPSNVLSGWLVLLGYPPDVMGAYQGVNRMGSILYTPVAFGALMAFAGTVTLVFFQQATVKRHRILLALLYLLFAFCCVMSLSRGSIVYLGIGSLVICYYTNRRIFSLFVIGTLLLLTTVSITSRAISSNNPILKHFETIFTGDVTQSNGRSRYAAVFEGWENFAQNPLGFGLGGAGHAAIRHADDISGPVSATQFVASDNWYIKTLDESGIFGIVSFLAFVIVFIITAAVKVSVPKKQSSWPLLLGSLATIIGFSFQGWGSNVWDIYLVSWLHYIMIGICSTIISPNHAPACRG